jgi:uncharacterized protein (TIGR02444 family)
MPELTASEQPDPQGRGVDAFWAFSLAFYARPGIAETCLALQDGDGLDVNLLLLCCWLGWSGQGRLDREDLTALDSGVAVWRGEIVERLRALRRVLKTMANPVAPVLRQDIQRLELTAEREEQRLLLAALPADRASPGDRFADAEHSLATYLATRGRPPELASALLGGLRNFR